MPAIRVFIVDDHQLVADGIQSLLSGSGDIHIAGQTNDPFAACMLMTQNPADILLTDINMPGMSGAELTRLAKKQFPELKVISLSMFCERKVIADMIRSGISGYILKNTGKAELLAAIRQVYEGKTFFSEEVTREMMKAVSNDDETSPLTNREMEIIRLIEKELSNKQIADKLFISERTVETHRKNIFRKTATQGVVGLLKYCREHKILS